MVSLTMLNSEINHRVSSIYDKEAYATNLPNSICAVEELRLANFRNYEKAIIKISDIRKPVVLFGDNGSGKTNILEALSLLAPGRGLRRSRLSDLKRIDNDAPWQILVNLHFPIEPMKIFTSTEKTATGLDRRFVKINGVPLKHQIELSDYVGAVWLTPVMDKIFISEPASRRRFFDRLTSLFEPSYTAMLSNYSLTLRQWTSLLKDKKNDDVWLSSLENTLSELGVAIAALRKDCIDRLNIFLENSDGAFPKASIAIKGILENMLENSPALEVEEQYKKQLKLCRISYMQKGSVPGPHNSDILVTHIGKNRLAGTCSTGEQKAVLVAIIIAHAKALGVSQARMPLILLDDIAEFLDEERKEALFDDLTKLNAQVWVTGTDKEKFRFLNNRSIFFGVNNAEITTIE